MVKTKKTKKTKKKINKIKKQKSLQRARLLSKKEYETYIHKRQKKKRMTKKQKKDLDHTLFINYCKCIKKLKKDKKTKKNLEYPICMSSVYTKRGFKPLENVREKCKHYY